jgi:FkbM family methyltransferase
LKQGNDSIAYQHFERALALNDNAWEAHLGLGELLSRQSKKSEALTHIDRAITLQPTNAAALQRKAHLLTRSHRYEEAMALCEKLIRQDAKNRYNHWNDLGNIKRDLGLLEEALTCYQKASALTKTDSIPLSNQITLLHYMLERDPEEILKLCKEWGRRFAPKAEVTRPVPSDLSPSRKLRVGMFSDGFRQHPVGAMTTTALENLVKLGFELYMYTTSGIVDTVTRRLMAIADRWTAITDVGDDALAQMIRQDGIDILIDLSGHNAGNRMRTMALEPAPVLVKWVGGLINTTGVASIDYLLTDAIESPPGSDHLYTEKLVRMPDDYICYMPPQRVPDVGPLPALKNRYVTFGCFNNPTKINEVVLSHWARLLHALPGSHLFLKGGSYESKDFQDRIRAILASHGIASDRVRLQGQSPHFQLFECYNEVDIALDPWPYSGGLTTCEAMLMGVPVITLPGPTFAGRHSATHLVNAGMPELVTANWDEYYERALELSSDLTSLATIRAHLRDILLRSPVCDAQQFARNLANALRAMWQRYCEDRAPAALSFTPEGLPKFEDDDEPMTLVQPEEHPESIEQDTTFSFAFKGQIVTLDHGGVLVAEERFRSLGELGAFQMISIDPAGRVKDAYQLQQRGELQHYHGHIALGDGAAATMYACLDARLSGTLEPLPMAQQLPVLRQDAAVLAKLAIPTTALDDINGLDRIDWLVLNDTYDNLTILQGAERLLSTLLIVHARVMFVDVFKNQTTLAGISNLLATYGFRLLRLENQQMRSLFSSRELRQVHTVQSQLLSCDVIFVPDDDRIKALNDNQRRKLAFLLHTVYRSPDLVHRVLQENDEQVAEEYLTAQFPTRSTAVSEQKNALTAELKQASSGSIREPLTPRNRAEDARQCVDSILPVDQAIFGLNIRPGKQHPLPGQLIVTLTSYKKRFETLHLTISCLLNQSVRADKVVLWIAYAERDLLPPNVLRLESRGLQIRYCDDLRSYKKLVPALQEYPDAFLVTADDDLHYPTDWLEKLVQLYDGDHKTVIAWRAHKIRLDKNRLPVPYQNWEWAYTNASEKSHLIFPTCGAGALYPPGAFHPDVTDASIFTKLCPDADDIWFYWMCRLNGMTFRVVGEKMPLIHWPGTQEEVLWKANIFGGENDVKIKNMSSRYGFVDTKSSLEQGDISSFVHRGRVVNFHLPNHQDHIQRIIKSTKNFYEFEMLQDIANRTPEKSIIIDIGANIGNHSIFFGMFCQAEKVLSFEPQPNVFKVLKNNIKLNDLNAKISAFNAGLGKEKSRARLGTVDEKNIGMTQLAPNQTGDIDVLVLDDVLRSNLSGKQRVSVIKIDVEGMELDVLKGSFATLKQHQPIVYAEAGTPSEFEKLKEFFSILEYTSIQRFNATATYLFVPKTYKNPLH